MIESPRARKNASNIILACRNTFKGESAVEAIFRDTKCDPSACKIQVWELDLTDYNSVLAFSTRVRTQLPRLDAFIANAGMELQEYRVAEHLEMHLAVNVVSTFLSAIAILPKLNETSTTYGVQTTLTFCGSMYHIFGPDEEFNTGLALDTDLFDRLSEPANTDIIWRYALSKLMDHLCFHGLVAALRDSRIDYSRVVVNLVNPGWCGTELSRAKTHPLGERVAFALMGWTAEKGSRAYLHALAAGEESHGVYLSGCRVKGESQFVRSERGERVKEKVWRDLMIRIEKVAPEVAGFIR